MSKVNQKVLDKLHEIATERKLKDYDVKVKQISTEGANYTSILYVVKISSKNEDDLNLFVKAAIMGDNMRDQVPCNVYKIEQFVYTQLKKAYRAVEEKHEVPERHRLFIPEYYGASIEPSEETLVIEDLGVKGFTTHDRFKSIDWPYASAAVHELVKIHTLSLAFQRECPDLYELFVNDYLDDFMFKEVVSLVLEPSVKSALAVLKDEHKGKFQKYFDQLDFATITRQFQPARFTVLAHGDFRPSNLMHRVLDVSTYSFV